MVKYKELDSYSIIEQDEDNILSVPADCFPICNAFLVNNDGIFIAKDGTELEVKAGDIVARMYGFLTSEIDAPSWYILKDECLSSIMKKYYEKEQACKEEKKVPIDIHTLANQLNTLQEQVNMILQNETV